MPNNNNAKTDIIHRQDLGLGKRAPYVNATVVGGMFGVLLLVLTAFGYFVNGLLADSAAKVDMLIRIGLDQATRERELQVESNKVQAENNRHQWDAIAANQRDLLMIGKMVEKHDMSTLEVVKQLQVLIDETKKLRKQ